MNGINSKDRFSFAKGYRARTIFLIFDILLLGILMCMMVLPLLKVIVDSIDPTSYGVRLWPRKIDFSAYEMILTTSSLYRPFLVSVLTTVVGTVTGLFIITMGAYVLIQKDMPGHVLMGRMVLFTMMFSGGMIPTYLTIKNLGLMNNMLAVIIPCSVSAYNTILMRSFFASIPNELFESATIDGCSPFGCFWRIMLPLSKPALASVAAFLRNVSAAGRHQQTGGGIPAGSCGYGILGTYLLPPAGRGEASGGKPDARSAEQPKSVLCCIYEK